MTKQKALHQPVCVRVAIFLAVLLALALAAGAPQAMGQEEQGQGQEPEAVSTRLQQPFWKCVTPGGSFLARLGNITSVSYHTYVVDGGAKVYETMVDTNGSVVARYYYLEILGENTTSATVNRGLDRARELMGQLNSRVTTDAPVWEQVVKNYPATTHAKTAEYRLASKEAVQAIYASAETAWMENEGAKLVVENAQEE